LDRQLYSMTGFSSASLRQELERRGVRVWSESSHGFHTIPVALTPTVVAASDWRDLIADTQVLLAIFPRLMAWLQRPGQHELFTRLFGNLKGLEAWAAASDPFALWGHATIRVDLYWHDRAIKIIEVNTTIPAMQAYSDQATRAWLAAGVMCDRSAAQICDNRGNLLKSLLALYRRDGGCVSRPRMAILHRPGDSQIAELENLAHYWSNRGYPTFLVTPERLIRVGDIWMVDGEPCDLVYRHIFAWRLEQSPLIESIEKFRTTHIYNPVSAHYESKAFLALLSQVADDPNIAASIPLSSAEVEVVKTRVPWSRVLSPQLLEVSETSLTSRMDQLVFKRSAGYGGHHVIVGDDWHSATTQNQLAAIMGGAQLITIRDFMDWAMRRDSSTWIVQERMSGLKRRTDVLTASGVETWDAWFDASLFMNTGASFHSGGGVSRVAKNPVVNIGTGGGLAPFVINKNK
jgi:hypothetical protein